MEKILYKYLNNIAKLEEVKKDIEDEFIINSINMIIYRIKSKVEEIEDEGEEEVFLIPPIVNGDTYGSNRRVRKHQLQG